MHMPQPLSALLADLTDVVVVGPTTPVIRAITLDSRQVQLGTLFVALRGTQTDGHTYIPRAIELGAVAILCEELPATTPEGITFIQAVNPARAMGYMASAFYGHPSYQLTLVGVTGTNGKTSVATFLFQLFRRLGYRCGLLSTVQNQIEDEVIQSTHTTPDSVAINRLLAEMHTKGCTHVFMEVSSHSVVQERIAGLRFAGGIFTNITHDHLDFHKTFDNYIKAKKGFFDQLPKQAFALINSDDRRGSVMVQNCAAQSLTYSLQAMASFRAKILSNTLDGLHLLVDEREAWFPLIGRFNAYNLLAAYGAAVALGESPDDVLMELSALAPPAGRFERVPLPEQKAGIVDYAHTPDALLNVLETIQQLRHDTQAVVTVVGCGGNRDATKRPQMAEIACKLSTWVILTSDNPRYEEPQAILDDMMKGVPPLHFKKVRVIADRREAIRAALQLTQPNDIILVAGKGHETYQEIQGVKYDFDDRAVLREEAAKS